MAKHFSEKERAQIIEQLCEIGHKEFTLRGLRAARIEDICRAAGISKGSFYNFFQAKEQLFLAIIEKREAVHREKLTRVTGLVPDRKNEELSMVSAMICDHVMRAADAAVEMPAVPVEQPARIGQERALGVRQKRSHHAQVRKVAAPDQQRRVVRHLLGRDV